MALVSLNERPRGRSVIAAGAEQRRRAMRAAKWHSVRVRVLRTVLPVAAVAMLACYGVFMQRTIAISSGDHQGRLNAGSGSLSLGKPTMHNPSYEGFNRKDGSQYIIRAKRAVTDLSEAKPIDLFGIAGELTQKDGVVTKIDAEEGTFERKVGKLRLFKGIKVKSSNGMAAQLSEAVILTDKGTIESSQPVAVEFPAGTLRGNQMLIRQKEREVIFTEGVVAKLNQQHRRPARAKAKETGGRGLVAFAGQSDQPVEVDAKVLFVKDSDQQARFSGGVTAQQGDARLQAKVMDIAYVGVGDGGESPGNVTRIIAREDVVITRGVDRIASAIADIDVPKNRAVLDGGVVVTSGADRRVMGQRAVVDTEKDTVLLTGQVIVVQGQNTLRGSRLFFDQRSGRMDLTRPTSGANAGRIKARFVQNASRKTPPKRAKVASNGRLGTQAFRTDPNAPVDIDALRLRVDDRKRIAVFDGGVRAVQGGFEIATNVLHANYSGAAGLSLGAGSAANAGQQKQGDNGVQLKSIHAPGRITVKSRDGQYAAGDNGTYNVAQNEIALVGNVVLKQGRQVIRGAKLVIDLNTGLSRMETSGGQRRVATGRGGQDPAKTVATKPKGVSDTANRRACGGRMCAVFFPGDFQKTKDGKRVVRSPGSASAKTNTRRTTPGQQKQSVGSSWSASTTSDVRPTTN